MAANFSPRHCFVTLLAMFLSSGSAQDCASVPSWFFDYGRELQDDNITSFINSYGIFIDGTIIQDIEYDYVLTYSDTMNHKHFTEDFSSTIEFKTAFYEKYDIDSGVIFINGIDSEDPRWPEMAKVVEITYGVQITVVSGWITTCICRTLINATDETPLTYQLVWVTGDNGKTYMINNYHTLSSDVEIFVDLPGNTSDYFLEEFNPVQESNSCEPGRWVNEVNLTHIDVPPIPECEWGKPYGGKCSRCGGCGTQQSDFLSPSGRTVVRTGDVPCPPVRCKRNRHPTRVFKYSDRKKGKYVGVARRCCYSWRNPGSDPKHLKFPARCTARRCNGYA